MWCRRALLTQENLPLCKMRRHISPRIVDGWGLLVDDTRWRPSTPLEIVAKVFRGCLNTFNLSLAGIKCGEKTQLWNYLYSVGCSENLGTNLCNFRSFSMIPFQLAGSELKLLVGIASQIARRIWSSESHFYARLGITGFLYSWSSSSQCWISKRDWKPKI